MRRCVLRCRRSLMCERNSAAPPNPVGAAVLVSKRIHCSRQLHMPMRNRLRMPHRSGIPPMGLPAVPRASSFSPLKVNFTLSEEGRFIGWQPMEKTGLSSTAICRLASTVRRWQNGVTRSISSANRNCSPQPMAVKRGVRLLPVRRAGVQLTCSSPTKRFISRSRTRECSAQQMKARRGCL